MSLLDRIKFIIIVQAILEFYNTHYGRCRYPVDNVEVVMETLGSNDITVGGTVPQRIWSCLSILEKFLNQSEPVVSSLVLGEKSYTSEMLSKGNISDTIVHILGTYCHDF